MLVLFILQEFALQLCFESHFFVHIIIGDSFELGRRMIEAFLQSFIKRCHQIQR